MIPPTEVYAAEVRPRAEAEVLIRSGVAEEMEPNVRAPALVLGADGAPIAAAARYGGDLGALRAAFMAYPMTTTKRAIGIRNRSAVFGYVSRRVHMKREGCRACGGAHDAPRAHRTILEAGATVAGDLAATIPERAARDTERAREVIAAEWLIDGTPWTSGVLNETSPLPYHYDRNNLDTWSAQVCVRRHTSGGHLHLPQFDIVFECRDGDVIYFPGWKYVHGVTPIHKRRHDAYRYTAVFYTVAGMAGCLAPDQELARARTGRSAREDAMMERQAAEGLMTPTAEV